MNRLWIKQARLIDPSSGIDQMGDLLVENGVIAAAGTVPAHSGDCETLDATGLCLAPGLVDMHVHLRDPGFTHKEDILTGCAGNSAPISPRCGKRARWRSAMTGARCRTTA